MKAIYTAGVEIRRPSVASLAGAPEHAGAVRAMELDIHDVWSTFNVYQPNKPDRRRVVATKLLPTMPRSAERYLTPDPRVDWVVRGADPARIGDGVVRTPSYRARRGPRAVVPVGDDALVGATDTSRPSKRV